MTKGQCFLNSWNFGCFGWITNIARLIAFWMAFLANGSSHVTQVQVSSILSSQLCNGQLLGWTISLPTHSSAMVGSALNSNKVLGVLHRQPFSPGTHACPQ